MAQEGLTFSPRCLLSICIPTYNRGKTVYSLVKGLLTIESDEMEIVVTETASPDDTRELLMSLPDPRLRVLHVPERMLASENMMECLFAAEGKYAIFCNDRDHLIPEGVVALLKFLRESPDYAVVRTTDLKSASPKVAVWEPGRDSLLHLKYVGHPTGMVFNRELMASLNLRKEAYYPSAHNMALLYTLYPHCRLAWDLCKAGRLAVSGIYAWRECNQNFKIQNRSGIGVVEWCYYLPKSNERLLAETFEADPQTLRGDRTLQTMCMKFFYRRILFYKSGAISKYEPIHYGQKRKFVTTVELMRCVRHYHRFLEDLVRKGVADPDAYFDYRKRSGHLYREAIRSSFRVDLQLIKAFFSRIRGALVKIGSGLFHRSRNT